MKIYLTKYALTDGILEAEATESKYIPGAASISYIYHPKWGNAYDITALKNEWAMYKEEARTQAEQKREKKIASLLAQIKKLERRVF